ncbi:MAG: glycosyltransferase family A protein [Desulfobulbaceae bacterium]|jgi:glycosyltransferase involved in cell wall biosynthesis|nr:glycosyltransferase family A protein [Desulfobulbaceae bacterium]
MTSLPVTVIIPTYNRSGGLLEKAIDSVLGQTWQNFELLIVDDGSTDNTAALLHQRYGKTIQILKMQNRGPGAARNHGVQQASHDLIAFLDSDDWWDKKKLELQVQVMAENPATLISHTDEVWYRHGKFLNQKKKHTRPHGDIFSQCLPLCCVGMSTVMMRRSFFAVAGSFDESLPCCEDYDLWLRGSGRVEFFKIDQPLTYKQGGREDQVSMYYRVGMDQFRIASLEKCLHLNGFSAQQRSLLAMELVRKCTIYGNGCIKHNRLEVGQKYLDLAERWKAT